MISMTLKQKAVEIVDGLPPAKVKRAIEYLEYLKGDYDTFHVHEKIKSGLREIKLMKEGKIKPKTLRGFLREL
jgi:hypothetical protein